MNILKKITLSLLIVAGISNVNLNSVVVDLVKTNPHLKDYNISEQEVLNAGFKIARNGRVCEQNGQFAAKESIVAAVFELRERNLSDIEECVLELYDMFYGNVFNDLTSINLFFNQYYEVLDLVDPMINNLATIFKEGSEEYQRLVLISAILGELFIDAEELECRIVDNILDKKFIVSSESELEDYYSVSDFEGEMIPGSISGTTGRFEFFRGLIEALEFRRLSGVGYNALKTVLSRSAKFIQNKFGIITRVVYTAAGIAIVYLASTSGLTDIDANEIGVAVSDAFLSLGLAVASVNFIVD